MFCILKYSFLNHYSFLFRDAACINIFHAHNYSDFFPPFCTAVILNCRRRLSVFAVCLGLLLETCASYALHTLQTSSHTLLPELYTWTRGPRVMAERMPSCQFLSPLCSKRWRGKTRRVRVVPGAAVCLHTFLKWFVKFLPISLIEWETIKANRLQMVCVNSTHTHTQKYTLSCLLLWLWFIK